MDEINVKDFIIKLIKSSPIMVEFNIKDIELDRQLIEYGIDSINFIAIVVEMEKYYNIEFEDGYLDCKKFYNIIELVDYVENLISLTSSINNKVLL